MVGWEVLDVRDKDKVEGPDPSSPRRPNADVGNGHLWRTGQKDLPPGMT